MNKDSVKVELIDWIAGLKDNNSIEKVLALKKSLTKPLGSGKIFGSGKHLIDFISDDFNESLDTV
jgi:hypothetical protein